VAGFQLDGSAAAAPKPAAVPPRTGGRGAGPRPRRWLTGTALFAASVAATGIASLFFHILATWTLGPAAYSALGSLLAVLMMLSVPVGAVQTLLSARVSRLTESGGRVDLGRLTRRIAAAGAAAGVAVCALSPAADAYLHLSGDGPVLLLGAYLVPLALGIVPWSFLCGTGRLGWLGAAATAGFAVRLGAGAILLISGFGVTGAMAAAVTGECVVTALLAAGALRARRGRAGGPAPRTLAIPASRTPPRSTEVLRRRGATVLVLTLREAALGSFAATGLWTLLGIDLIVARHCLAPGVAGVYAATALAARAVLAVAQTVATSSLRRFASKDERRAGSALRASVLVAVTAGALGTTVLAAAGRQTLSLLFGPGFAADTGLVVLLGLDATALAVLSVLFQFRLARSGAATGAGWAGAICFVGCLTLFPTSPVGLASALAEGALCALLIAAPESSPPTAPRTPSHRIRPAPPQRAAPRPPRSEPALSGPGTLELSVVVPYFNPGDALRRTVDRLIDVLTAAGHAFEIIAVCDGSTDDSSQRLAAVEDLRLRHVAHGYNRGKGAALRTGFARARGRYIGFIDGDGDLDPAILPGIRNSAALGDLDAVIGAKEYAHLRHARTKRENARRVFSVGYRALVRSLFSLRVRDTQTGVKIFRREALADVLPRCRQDRYAIDLELLAWMHRLGYRRVLEVPVALERRGASTITAASVVRLLADTLALRLWLAGFPLRWAGTTRGTARISDGLRWDPGATAVPAFGEPFAASVVGVLPAGRILAPPHTVAGTG